MRRPRNLPGATLGVLVVLLCETAVAVYTSNVGHRRPVLVMAAQYGDVTVVDMLVQRGARVDAGRVYLTPITALGTALLDEGLKTRPATVTALVTALLDEGLKTRRFPGVVYRSGPAGRRAALVRGPDVWEVIRAIRSGPGRGEQRLQFVAESSGLAVEELRVAVDFYTAFPDEVDARIAADKQVQAELREATDRREHLLSS